MSARDYVNAIKPFRVWATAVCAGFALLSAAAAAQSEQPVEVDIKAQDLSSALTTFGRQTKTEIAFTPAVVDLKQAPAVKGEMTRVEVLETLLADTSLEYHYMDNGTIIVRPAAASESGDTEPGKTLPASSPVPVAQNQTSATRTLNNQTSEATAQKNENETPPVLEEIIATGSHIRGVEAVGAAAMTFSREEISNTGYSTAEEFFESLPQNLDEVSMDASFATGISDVAAGNSQGASSVSLRGLGPGSTLVLLNGKRRPGNIRGRAVDTSAIPLSMIKRIEVVTGGGSAIYGSDAVAGVVNIVTVSELDGAETQISYGEASAGGERFNFSQTFGRTFDKGGFVLGYDYREDQVLDATATGLVPSQSLSNVLPVPGLYFLRRPTEQHVGLFAGQYELSNKVELYSDAQFSSDNDDSTSVFGFRGLFDIGGVGTTESNQYSATAGVRFDVGKEWQLDVSGLHGVVDTIRKFNNIFAAFGSVTDNDFPPTQKDEDEAIVTSFSAIADGPLGRVGNGAISSAIGIEFRNESYKRQRFTVPDNVPVPAQDENLDRDIGSIFGEVHLPLIDRNGQRVEVSLAGRYEDYSDFGDTFNPRIGIEWQPVDSMTFRGSYSEAFRAPDLFTVAFTNQTRVRTLADPLNPGTTASVVVQTGGNPDLQPEEADTYTLGIDWAPSDRTKLSLSYFNIEYEGRIDQPGSPTGTEALDDEALFPGLINRTPTAAQLEAFSSASTRFTNTTGIPFDPETDDAFTTFPNIIIFDNRRNNIGLESIDGFDFQVSSGLETGSGDWSFGLNGTYYLDFTRNITTTSPTIGQLNQPGKTVDLRARGQIGWSRSAWSIISHVNYVDGYEDTFAATPTDIDSWTTVDLTLRYDASQMADGGFLNGVRVTLAIDNLFDEDPPAFLNNNVDIGYDAANADPIGRFVSLRLSKNW